jgi:hypothetical protein
MQVIDKLKLSGSQCGPMDCTTMIDYHCDLRGKNNRCSTLILLSQSLDFRRANMLGAC